jgi:hypothetical protein
LLMPGKKKGEMKTPRCSVIAKKGKQCRRAGNWVEKGRPVCGTHAKVLRAGGLLEFVRK